ncbi:hypothetical protein CPB84DRAFT_1745337 [Gymnopilus junonius]|uniref:G-protein coupled receptors family 2 profile 2 domain-containing protein n=1 Tax=Gymnopilus junonius TaxID=109634 RepID=A0A9P5TPZ9_GYMJU|nr:hypothetical protein CPB84DRAFT_1745337 [Gymnopilus junonius]
MSSNSSDSSGDSGGGFTITDSQITFSNNLASFGTIPGTCVCFLVLVAYGIVASFPNARKYLDRVSFRILVYALVSNVGFGIAYAATPAAPGAGCNFGAFCVNLFLTFSTFFTTCIAINLQLVLVHHKNGQHLEKYYLIGTVFLTLLLNVPTFALHQFGWDEQSDTCWYKNGDPNLKLRWIIGTQSFWVALAATIETICSTIIIIWMYLYQRTTRVLQQAVLDAGPMGKGGTKMTNTLGTTKVNTTTKGIITKGTATKVSSSKASSTRVNDAARVDELMRKRPTDITRDPRYRNAILRIGVNTQGEFRLLLVDLFFYAIRPLAYGLIAATDPSSSDKMSANMEFVNMGAGEKSTGGTASITATPGPQSGTQQR